MRAAIPALVALVSLLPASSALAQGAPRRFAIVSGASDGGPTRATLRWATSDARQVARVLRRLGGVAVDDLVVVEEPDAAALRAALARVGAEAGRARREGQRVELFLYFSGHSDESGLLLGKSQLPYAELRGELERLPADVRVAILDSCSSGAITRAKGGVHSPPFLLDASSKVKGHAFLTSSAADEASQESERLRGSYFTHALLTGLRGGADASGDGVVTLNEAYQFAYRETLARTETTRGGPQHATYDIGLVGSGDVVMTDLRRADAVLVIPPALEGTLFVRNAAGQLVAELRKIRGAGIELALEEGRYDLRVALEGSVSSTSVVLSATARAVLDPATLTPTPLEVTTLRGEEPPGDSRPAVADPAATAAAGPRPLPLQRTQLALQGGVAARGSAPDNNLTFGGRLSAGTWLLEFLGVDASLGFWTTKEMGAKLVPAVPGYVGPEYSEYIQTTTRDVATFLPLSLTLKLAMPSRGVRPYLVIGADLTYVRLERQPTYPIYGIVPQADPLVVSDLVLGGHAGVGAILPVTEHLSALVEARYTFGEAQIKWLGRTFDTIDLGATHLTAGAQYTF